MKHYILAAQYIFMCFRRQRAYEQSKKKDTHHGHHCTACYISGVHIPHDRQELVLSHTFLISSQLYLYRTVCRMGAFGASAYRAETGQAMPDGSIGTSDPLDDIQIGKIFYILAADSCTVFVVSALSSDAVRADACRADSYVSRQTRRIPPAEDHTAAVGDIRGFVAARLD